MNFIMSRTAWYFTIGGVVFLIFLNELLRGYFSPSAFSAYRKTVRSTPYGRFFILLAAATIAALCLDPILLGWVQAIQHPAFLTVLRFGAWFGAKYNLWFIVIGLYVTLALGGNKKGARFCFSTLISLVISVALSFVAKRAFLRARPNMDIGSLSFFNLDGLLHGKSSFQSFPSGDVAVAVGAAAFLFYAIKNRYVRWAVLMIPFVTSLSRMSLDRHWPSDTVFALGSGLIAALLVWQYHKALSDAAAKA